MSGSVGLSYGIRLVAPISRHAPRLIGAILIVALSSLGNMNHSNSAKVLVMLNRQLLALFFLVLFLLREVGALGQLQQVA